MHDRSSTPDDHVDRRGMEELGALVDELLTSLASGADELDRHCRDAPEPWASIWALLLSNVLADAEARLRPWRAALGDASRGGAVSPAGERIRRIDVDDADRDDAVDHEDQIRTVVRTLAAAVTTATARIHLARRALRWLDEPGRRHLAGWEADVMPSLERAAAALSAVATGPLSS